MALGLARTRRPSIVQLDFPGDGVTAETPSTRQRLRRGTPRRFGALASPLLSRVPVLVTGGNHEIGSSEAWLHYLHRWPTPYREARSTSPLYWSADVGPVARRRAEQLRQLCQSWRSPPAKWLEDDLSSVDRSATPWLIVMMHAPFYNSNSAHALEAELMRLTYEPLLLKYGVDVVLSGHVHAYERSDARGIYDAQPNQCGPVYLNLGDGGNREGGEAAWVAPHPPWSAFRESSFGVGALDIVNATHASYAWHRDACGAATAPHYDLAANDCATPHDAGGAPHVAIDAIVLRRDLRASPSCAALRRTRRRIALPRRLGHVQRGERRRRAAPHREGAAERRAVARRYYIGHGGVVHPRHLRRGADEPRDAPALADTDAALAPAGWSREAVGERDTPDSRISWILLPVARCECNVQRPLVDWPEQPLGADLQWPV